MADEHRRFVALGPNDGPSVEGETGFFTKATRLDYGVNAQGNVCGIYGESLEQSDTGRVAPESRTAVSGAGDNVGICGTGRVAIFGFGRGSDSPNAPTPPGPSPRTGVMGIGQGTAGAGVHGVHTASAPIDGSAPPPESQDYPPMTNPGAGVYGIGLGAYGGVFESTPDQSDPNSPQLGQINLTPGGGNLPAVGRTGDVFVSSRVNSDGNTDINIWLCIQASDQSTLPQWVPLRPGQPLAGGNDAIPAF